MIFVALLAFMIFSMIFYVLIVEKPRLLGAEKKPKQITSSKNKCRLCGWMFHSNNPDNKLCFRQECMDASAYCKICRDIFHPVVEGDECCANCYEYNKRYCDICDGCFVPDSPHSRTCHGCHSGQIQICDVPECRHSATDHNEEFDWHFCHEHADWFKSRINTIEVEFPKAVKYLTDYDEWRFQAELQEYPQGCYDDLKFYQERKREHHIIQNAIKKQLENEGLVHINKKALNFVTQAIIDDVIDPRDATKHYFDRIELYRTRLWKFPLKC